MKETIFLAFVHHTAVLVAFAMLYENFWLKSKKTKSIGLNIISGCVLSAIGIILMLGPWQVIPGVYFDGRSILLAISGLFFGPIPTLIAMVATGTMRVLIGGDGVAMGLAIIISSGTIGLLWRKFRPDWRQHNIIRELIVFGLIVHLVMIADAFLLPHFEVLLTIKTAFFPIILVYSTGTVLLGLLMVRQTRNFENILAIEKSLELERRLSNILKSGNILSILLDTNGNIVFCNKYFLELTGYNEDEVVNKQWIDLFVPAGLKPDMQVHYEEAMQGSHDNGVLEYEIFTKKGEKIFISWQFISLLNEESQVSGFQYIGVNITDRINYEMQLETKGHIIQNQNEEYFQINEEYQQINEELIDTIISLGVARKNAEESDRLKSAFLANMSHEIRTPMNGILGFADLLEQQDLTLEEQITYVGVIKRSGVRMLNIINNLIDISRIESGQVEANYSNCNINHQMDFIYKFFEPEATAKGILLDYKNGLSENAANIRTDAEKVYAILTNLVKNAIKYTDSGTIEFGYVLKVFDNSINLELGDAISIKGESSFLEFYVRDTGIGIPADRQSAVFLRFVQADISDHRAFQGAGLGLTITKAYIEMLKGKIWLQSAEGKGSTFYFSLPYIPGSAKNPSARRLSKRTFKFGLSKKINILVVEDDPNSMLLITEILKKMTNHLILAYNGLEAINACLLNNNIDLVLMDIQMPVMDGYESVRKIRQFNKDVVIVAQTAFALVGDREKAIEAGCNDYISKPLTKEVLTDIIVKHIKKSV